MYAARNTIIALGSITLLAGLAQGDVLYDNFDYSQGDPGYGFFGFGVNSNLDGVPDFAIGQTFVVEGGDYYLDSLLAPIFFFGDLSGALNEGLILSLQTNNDEGLPGTVLEQTIWSDLPGPGDDNGNQSPPVLFEFSGTTLLEEGERYWLTLTLPDDENTYDFVWFWNTDFDLLAPYAVSEDRGPWQGGVFGDVYLPQAAFRVEGTLVPTPGVLAGFAVFGLMGTRRRRN